MDDGTATAPGQLNLGSLGTAAGGLLSFIAAVSLSGALGRVARDEGVALEWALFAVLLGAGLLAAAGLSATGKLLEVIFSIVGLLFTLTGFVIAAVVAVRTGGHTARPSVTASLDDSGRAVKGTVALATLRSDSRVVAVVQGVVENPDGTFNQPTVLTRADLGPDEEGKVDYQFTTRLPAGRYDDVRVTAWTADADASTAKTVTNPDPGCDLEPADTASAAGHGCVILPIAPVPTGPELQARWVAKQAEVQVEVKAANAAQPVSVAEATTDRVGIVVARATHDVLYEAVLQPDADGTLDTKFRVPVPAGSRHVCVSATYLQGADSPAAPTCPGSASEFSGAQPFIELNIPAKPKPKPTRADP